MEKAVITNIQGYSIHDGPGIRTVVFTKGCPLRCRWCANPENLSKAPQVGFISKLCTGCLRCMKHCEERAISATGYRIIRDRCVSCGKCADSCFYGALVRYGEVQTSEEVFQKVRRDKMFYDESGGGVTVSGGEPLMYPGFVRELFEMCRGEGINTLVETCGYADRDALIEVFPVTDMFYFDLKHLNDEIHREYTGCSNFKILENGRYIAEHGGNVLFRQPLIPGVNDSDGNIAATAAYIKELGLEESGIQLMPYHRAGKSKYDALDMPYEMEETKIMSAREIEAVAEKYRQAGINCSVSK